MLCKCCASIRCKCEDAFVEDFHLYTESVCMARLISCRKKRHLKRQKLRNICIIEVFQCWRWAPSKRLLKDTKTFNKSVLGQTCTYFYFRMTINSASITLSYFCKETIIQPFGCNGCFFLINYLSSIHLAMASTEVS